MLFESLLDAGINNITPYSNIYVIDGFGLTIKLRTENKILEFVQNNSQANENKQFKEIYTKCRDLIKINILEEKFFDILSRK